MNCIEADNEINLTSNRIDALDLKLKILNERLSVIFDLIESRGDGLISYLNFRLKDIEKSLEKCHPKFDEDGIL
jgi:hypothetical protein